MDNVFCLAKLGSSFATRDRAAEIYKDFTTELSGSTTNPVILDFTGVNVISPSFAMELVGLLLARHEPGRFDIRVSEPVVRERIRDAISRHSACVHMSKRACKGSVGKGILIS